MKIDAQVIDAKIKKYAEMCQCSYEQAEIRVKHFQKIEEESEKARICPKCKNKSLMLEYASESEYCTQRIVVCMNDDDVEEECNFTSDLTDEYMPLDNGYDFDEVAYYAVTDLKEKGVEKAEEIIGMTWSEFIDKANKSLLGEAVDIDSFLQPATKQE